LSSTERRQISTPAEASSIKAVDAEGRETEAMRRDPEGDGNYRLNRHPRDCEHFEPKRFPDQRCTLDIRNAGTARRRSTTVERNGYAIGSGGVA
jgi:hypothetical protein